MAFCKEFNLYSWQYKVGFGGRGVPTRRRVTAKAAFFTPPLGLIQPSSLVDEDAQAVRAKAREERMEEDELQRMTEFDKPKEIQREVSFGDGPVFEEQRSFDRGTST